MIRAPALAAHPADAAIPPAGRDVHPACGMDALSGPWWGNAPVWLRMIRGRGCDAHDLCEPAGP